LGWELSVLGRGNAQVNLVSKMVVKDRRKVANAKRAASTKLTALLDQEVFLVCSYYRGSADWTIS
jgi:hypothetical protein